MPKEPTTPHPPVGFAELPIQPTGSGVQDLEIAYEQMRLSEAAPGGSGTAARQVGDGASPNADDPMPTVDDEATRISAAHPS